MNLKILIIAMAALSGFITFGMGIFSLKRRHAGGAPAFSALMLSVSLYCWGYAIELSQDNLPGMRAGLFIEYVGLAFLPSLWLVLALQYTGTIKRLTWKAAAALSAVPLVTIVLMNTTEYHGLYYTSMGIEQSGSLALFSREVGPWYYVQFAYLNAMLLSGNVLYLRMVIRSAPAFRNQAINMLAGSLVPWVTNLVYMAGLGPRGIDINVFALTLTSPFFVFGIFRSKMLDLAPVARGIVFESMDDPIVVLDTSNRIIDVNNAAKRLFSFLDPGAVGKDVLGLVKDYPSLERQIAADGRDPVELYITDNGTERYFRSRITGFTDSKARPLGRIVTLHEVTEQTILMRKLEELATVDELTKVFNRRMVLELGQREILAARRHGRPLSLVMMDIDHFKHFNDTYGHQAGDKVLAAVADACRGNLRATDVFGRYGGEEFIALFPDTGPDTAVEIADTLRLIIAGKVIEYEGKALSLTASFGVTGMARVTSQTLDELLKRADRALYLAKERGRNRVESG